MSVVLTVLIALSDPLQTETKTMFLAKQANLSLLLSTVTINQVVSDTSSAFVVKLMKKKLNLRLDERA